jgi:hypothetical protein
MIRADRRELSDDMWIRHHPKRDFGGRRSRAGDECLLLLGRHSALFGHLARLHDRRRAESTASLRFAMRGYNEPNFAHGGSTVPYAARVQGA